MRTSKQRLLVWSLGALLVVAHVRQSLAQDSETGPFDPNSPDAQYLFGFPFCKCDDYRCGSSPYLPVKRSEEVLSNGNFRVCFEFQDVGCQTGNACCESILQLMTKIEFMAGALCIKRVVGR